VRLSASPGRAAVALGLLMLTLLACWAVWQPLRAADANAAALSAASNGKLKAAIADAGAAASRDPVGVDSLFELAAIYVAAGDPQAAHAQLVRAVDRQPQNAQTWLQLGEFDLNAHHPRAALGSLAKAKMLDLSSYQVVADISRANAELTSAGSTG
jgi:cytochrome c-type biogenesis protein CcmH/NrfG